MPLGWPLVLGFALAVLPICLTPGTSFTLVTSRVLARGRRGGALVAAGTACGIVCHATLAGLGLAPRSMQGPAAGCCAADARGLRLWCWRRGVRGGVPMSARHAATKPPTRIHQAPVLQQALRA